MKLHETFYIKMGLQVFLTFSQDLILKHNVKGIRHGGFRIRSLCFWPWSRIPGILLSANNRQEGHSDLATFNLHQELSANLNLAYDFYDYTAFPFLNSCIALCNCSGYYSQKGEIMSINFSDYKTCQEQSKISLIKFCKKRSTSL